MTRCFRHFAILLAFALFTPTANAASIDLELTGLVPAKGGDLDDYGYGSKGLYLGDDWASFGSRYANWTWDPVDMHIAMDGDATISGSMTRGDGSVWGLDVQLSGIRFVGDVFRDVTTFYDGIFRDLENAHENGAGFEWTELTMSLTSPYDTVVPLDGWVGLAMPRQGHDNPAEMHYRNGHVFFDAWYQNPGNDHCGGHGKHKKKSKSYCYNVGDTKAKVHMPVPEPTTGMLIGISLLAAAHVQRRRS